MAIDDQLDRFLAMKVAAPISRLRPLDWMPDGTLAAARVLEGTKRLAASGGADLLGLIRTLGLVVIAVVAAVFFIQNLATIEVAFLTWSISAPRAFIFLLVFGMGLIAGYLLSALRPRRQSGPQHSTGNMIGEHDKPQTPDISE